MKQRAVHRRHRRDLRTLALYTWVMLREFRWTLGIVLLAVAGGALLWGITTVPGIGRPPPFMAIYGGWMMLFAQPIVSPPPAWYLELASGMYPLIGVVVVGEGIVRFAMLMVSRRRGEKEWMKVMASTYRDHVILCGLGHLGFRVLQQLVAHGRPVVAIEKDAGGRFLEEAKATGVPVLVRDMKDDQTLVDAGVTFAKAILIATNDDIANVEVALDARRMNPSIRIAMRQFDQKLASKFQQAFQIEFAFSSSALAAPTVAAMSLEANVLSAFDVAGVPHVSAEIELAKGSSLAGRTVSDVENGYQVRVLARGPTVDPPPPSTVLAGGDKLLIHATVERAENLIRAAR